MISRLRKHAGTIVVAMVTAAITAAAPAIAATVVDYAKNADKVDGKHAVGAGATVDQRKGKLVATGTQNGRLPNNIIAKALDSNLLDGVDGTGYVRVGQTVQEATHATNADNASHATNADEAAHAASADNATNADHATNADSATNASQAGNADLLDGLDSPALWRGSIYVREMVTNGSANASGTCPDGDVCFAGGFYCDTGDALLGGGFAEIDNGTRLVASEPFTPNPQDAWRIKFVNNSTEDTITVYTMCADLGAAHGVH
jgi:hypothetical protein